MALLLLMLLLFEWPYESGGCKSNDIPPLWVKVDDVDDVVDDDWNCVFEAIFGIVADVEFVLVVIKLVVELLPLEVPFGV